MNMLDERFEGLFGTITEKQTEHLKAMQAALGNENDETGAELALDELQNSGYDGSNCGWPAVLRAWVNGEYGDQEPAEDWRARALEAEARAVELRRQVSELRGEVACLQDALRDRLKNLYGHKR